MSGFLTNGVPNIVIASGVEQLPIDTQNTAGENPESGSITLAQLAAFMKVLNSTADHATVSGTRYYVNYSVAVPTLITGIQLLVGSTGGTDNWNVELHNAAGAVVANSVLTGTTAGTANTWQQIAFTAPYSAVAGTYFLVLQSNGTTAKYAAWNAPFAPGGQVNGSATGTFGTLAAITPPTTYTQGLGPMALPYQ